MHWRFSCFSVVIAAAVGTLCLGLAGCGGGNASKPAAGGKPTVAFVTNNSYEFWTIARRGTEKGAKEFDATVDFKMPARGTTEEQRAIVEDLVAKGVQGIAISPIDSANQASFLNEIGSRVPLLTHDSDLPTGSERLCYIGTENYTAGMAAGKLVRECLPDGGNLVIYVGKMDAQNAKERRQGVLDELAGEKDAPGPTYGKFTLLDTMTDDAIKTNAKPMWKTRSLNIATRPRSSAWSACGRTIRRPCWRPCKGPDWLAR